MVEKQASQPEKAETSQLNPNSMDTTQNEQDWGMVAHLSQFAGSIVPLGNFLGPLLILLFKGSESDFIDRQAREAFNFQLSLTAYLSIAVGLAAGTMLAPVAAPDMTGGFLFMAAIAVGGVVSLAITLAGLILPIRAALIARKGTTYEYPWTFRLI